MTDGGYDDGYTKVACFWGTEPGRLVRHLATIVPSLHGLRVLDVGCGEGKNASFLAGRGAEVTAIDCSQIALARARTLWSSHYIEWLHRDAQDLSWPPNSFDVVVAYGVFHCLPSPLMVTKAIKHLQDATKIGGYHVVCAFNARAQDLSAHPGFKPCLLQHREYMEMYSSWSVITCSDEDLNEVHPHNDIPHVHAMTRILARKG